MLNNLINMKKKPRKSSKLPFFIKNNAVSQQYDRFKKKTDFKRRLVTLQEHDRHFSFFSKRT